MTLKILLIFEYIIFRHWFFSYSQYFMNIFKIWYFHFLNVHSALNHKHFHKYTFTNNMFEKVSWVIVLQIIDKNELSLNSNEALRLRKSDSSYEIIRFWLKLSTCCWCKYAHNLEQKNEDLHLIVQGVSHFINTDFYLNSYLIPIRINERIRKYLGIIEQFILVLYHHTHLLYTNGKQDLFRL